MVINLGGVKMLTEFGKLCRIIRMQADDNLGDMAEKLSIKSSFLSAIENGKRNVPKGLCEEIKGLYDLQEKDYNDLLEAAEKSKTQVKICMEKFDSSDRDLVISFARKFGELDKADKEKIMLILKGENR